MCLQAIIEAFCAFGEDANGNPVQRSLSAYVTDPTFDNVRDTQHRLALSG